MAIKEGWTGRFFEDFGVGEVYQHPLGRTVTEADNTWFALLTMNTNQMHFNSEYAAKSEFSKPLVVSTLTGAEVSSFKRTFYVYKRGAEQLGGIFPKGKKPLSLEGEQA